MCKSLSWKYFIKQKERKREIKKANSYFVLYYPSTLLVFLCNLNEICRFSILSMSPEIKITVLLSPACEPGSFGSNCLHSCGHCLDEAVCEPESGDCPWRCQPGWSGSRCDAGQQRSENEESMVNKLIYR